MHMQGPDGAQLVDAFVDDGWVYVVFIYNDGSSICVRRCEPETPFKGLLRAWFVDDKHCAKSAFLQCCEDPLLRGAIKEWVEKDGEPIKMLVGAHCVDDKIYTVLKLLGSADVSDNTWEYIGRCGHVIHLKALLQYFNETNNAMALDRTERVFDTALDHNRYSFVHNYFEARCQPEFSLARLQYKMRGQPATVILTWLSRLFKFFERAK